MKASSASSAFTVRVDDGIAEVVLHRERANVLDQAMMRDLIEELTRNVPDDSLRGLVVRSDLRLFSAGVDVAEHRGDAARPTLLLLDRLLGLIEDFPLPTIALIAGGAFGGGLELALACDLRIVAEEAKLGLPETNLGVFPPYAVTRLPQLIGRSRTARLVLTGATFDGAEAERLGIADWVAPRSELGAVLAQVVDSLRSKSGATLRIAKQALRAGQPDEKERRQVIDRVYLDRLMATEDADEGMVAFLEKRAPVWQHR